MADLLACPICGKIHRLPAAAAGQGGRCTRCGSGIDAAGGDSLQRTAAFAVGALILYAPANFFPILKIRRLGAYSESTIWEGCVALFSKGMWEVALAVFLASIAIPLLKLGGLLFLSLTAASPRFAVGRTRLYKVIHLTGPWSMLDVFLVAILVALVKLGQMVTVLPGPGLVAFTGVVVLSTLASSAFDPRQIWRGAEGDDG